MVYQIIAGNAPFVVNNLNKLQKEQPSPDHKIVSLDKSGSGVVVLVMSKKPFEVINPRKAASDKRNKELLAIRKREAEAKADEGGV
jgi:hypothetical protein